MSYDSETLQAGLAQAGRACFFVGPEYFLGPFGLIQEPSFDLGGIMGSEPSSAEHRRTTREPLIAYGSLLQVFFYNIQRVEFRDTDAAGIAHFSVFFNWMERAEHAFLRHLGFSVVEPREGFKISWPRVATQCDFRRPLHFEQRFAVQVAVLKLGRTSCTYRFQFIDPQTVLTGFPSQTHGSADEWSDPLDWVVTTPHGNAMASGTITAVCCSIQPGKSPQPIEIPPEWRQSLESYCLSETTL